jgi:hypothetical protein
VIENVSTHERIVLHDGELPAVRKRLELRHSSARGMRKVT